MEEISALTEGFSGANGPPTVSFQKVSCDKEVVSEGKKADLHGDDVLTLPRTPTLSRTSEREVGICEFAPLQIS